jgi:aminoglycoside phosphotransferase (APT) family kinase protein
LLLAAGADVNLLNAGGDTALAYAAMKGNLDMVKLLLAAGADPASVVVVREMPDRRITVRQRGVITKVFAPAERAAWERERNALAVLAGRASWVATLVAAGEDPALGSWVVMSELPGQAPPSEMDAGVVHVEIGRMAARLHGLTVRPSPSTPSPLLDAIRELVSSSGLDGALAASAVARLMMLEASVTRERRVPKCLVHGDWGTSNLLWDRDSGAVGMVDWEDAHVGDPVDDLQWMCLHGFASDELRCAATGYQEIRSLGPLAAERLALAACRLAAEVAGWTGSDEERQRNRAAARRVFGAVIAGELPRLH